MTEHDEEGGHGGPPHEHEPDGGVAIATETRAASGPVAPAGGELGVRLVGLAWLVAFGALFFFVGKAAWTSDLGTENERLRLVQRLATLILLYPAVLGGIALATGAQPAAAVNPLGLPYRPRWFRTFLALAGREVLTFFTTPVPYVVYTAWLALNGFLFFLLLSYYTQPGADYQTPPGRLLFDNIFFWLSVWVICPALTMRLIAEEKRLGTIETLLTAPVTDVQVVLAKFVGVMIFYTTMVATAIVYLALLAKGSREWDWGPVLSSYLDVLLVGGFYLSIGLFMSSLTQNQIIAFVGAAVLNLFTFFPNALESFVKNENVRAVARYLSVHTHFQDLLIGIVSTKSLIFFVSCTMLMLFFSVLGLGSQRWR